MNEAEEKFEFVSHRIISSDTCLKKKTFLMVQRDQRHSETASTAAEEFSDPSNHHPLHHGVWKSQKSLIQHCERSELRLPFEWTKVNEKCQLWRLFENLKACGQTVLQDRSLLIGHKLVKNAKIQRFKWDILSGLAFIEMPKLVNFGVGDFFENLNFAVKQCYQTDHY